MSHIIHILLVLCILANTPCFTYLANVPASNAYDIQKIANRIASPKADKLSRKMTESVCCNTGRIAQPIGQNIKWVQGVLQKVAIGGQEALVLSIPINTVKLGLKTGAYAGVATFVFAEGVSVYRFAHGDITEDEFVRQSVKNLGTALAIGAATFICVALGCNPYGWVVAGVCIGTAIIVDLAFEYFYSEFKTPIITMDDVLGNLPTDLQRRPNIWDHSGFDYLQEENQNRLELFPDIHHQGILSIPQRNAILNPLTTRHTVLGD